MNSVIKQQLFVFSLLLIYIIIRLIGISAIPLSLWQRVYWGNALKNTFLLFSGLSLLFFIINTVRFNARIGPTIIQAKKLKLALFIIVGLGWLATVTQTIFDSLKILLPFKQLFIYQFADLLDETVAHIFLFLPIIAVFFIVSILEIERPLPRPLKRKETILLVCLNAIIGIIWGLNLTEGRLSVVTSLPAMVIYLVLMIYLFSKHHLSWRLRPWNLSLLIISFTGSIGLTGWGLAFRSFPQLFSVLN